MRLVCLHADTVDALKRLSIQFEDLTPNGLWSSQYHLVGLTPEQVDALDVFQVESEDVTPAQLVEAAGQSTTASRSAPPDGRQPARAPVSSGAGVSAQREVATAGAAAIAGTPDQAGREQTRASAGAESEVPLAQARDSGMRAAETKPESKPEAKAAVQAQPQTAAAQSTPTQAGQATASQPAAGQKNAGAKGGIPVPQAQGRKGQQGGATPSGGQRYGTTRLRISVAGKYTEATVANGKIVVGGRTFDSPDQAAAELTKSRGDWTFWEYYDSTDGKWRMLTRDWDTVLKSAAPGGR